MKNTKNEIIVLQPNTLRSEHSIPLRINEQRILLYSVYKIQTSASSVTFTKKELEEIYGRNFGSFKDISRYLVRLRTFGMDIINETTNKIEIVNAFSKLIYDNGVFTFKFNQEFLPAINKQKRYLMFNQSAFRYFETKYTLYLYDFLKDNMWGPISQRKDISLIEFRNIFKLDEKTNADNKNFKSRVWKPAMDEINKYTGYKINITTKGRGAAVRFNIYRIINEDLIGEEAPITVFKCGLGKNVIDFHCRECMKINKCIYPLDESKYQSDKERYFSNNSWRALDYYMEEVLWINKYYSLEERIKNRCAQNLEKAYYNQIIQNQQTINSFAIDGDEEFSASEAIAKHREWTKEWLDEYMDYSL